MLTSFLCSCGAGEACYCDLRFAGEPLKALLLERRGLVQQVAPARRPFPIGLALLAFFAGVSALSFWAAYTL